MGTPKDRAGRDEKAFTGPGPTDPPGHISKVDCANAGLHDPGTWAVVQDIDVGDLMLLSGFHERNPPHRKLPPLTSPQGASIIKALEFHTGMNYMGGGHGGGGEAGALYACCTCLG